MKYLKLYEAFESDAISKVLKYVKTKVGEKQSQDFLSGLREIIKNYDFPIDKISDSDVRYLSYKKALPIKSKASNEFGVYCLKFWFSLQKGYIGFTGVGDRVMSISNFKYVETGNSSRINTSEMNSDIVDYIKNTLNIKTGIMTRVEDEDYTTLNHGDDIIALFDDSDDLSRIGKGKIFKDGRYLFGIQDVASGNLPNYSDGTVEELGNWRDWGRRAWSLGRDDSPNDDHRLLYKYTESDEPLVISDYVDKQESNSETEVNHFLYNLPLNRNGGLKDWSRYKDENTSTYNKNWKDVEDADFCVIIYIDNLLKSEFKKTTDVSKERKESRTGAISLMTEKELRNANIERYMNQLLGKMGISSKKLELKNLQKYIASNILGDYSYFAIYRNRPELSETKKFSSRLLELLKLIKRYDNPSEYRKEEVEDFYNSRISNVYIHNNQSSSKYKIEYDNGYQRYIKGINDVKEEKKRKYVKEYLDICKEIGKYINSYVSSQEVNSIDDYIFLYNKITSIQSVMWDDNFKPSSTLTRHIIENLSNKNNLDAVINYINDMSDDSIEEFKEDIQKTKKVKSYVESILK